MILWTNVEITKVARWDYIARVFKYACQSCGKRPALEDSDSFLLAGMCRTCCRAPASGTGAGSTGGVMS
jgi:hypothetical protein